MNKFVIILVLVLAGTGIFLNQRRTQTQPDTTLANLPDQTEQTILEPNAPDSLTIASLRAQEYTGSPITIEETLSPGSNYTRYLTSYQSEGLKIYGLLTIPRGE